MFLYRNELSDILTKRINLSYIDFMDSLVIVESPSKAKTIKKYLGKGFEVVASKGHIVDLPKSELGVDVEHNFKPKYKVTKRKALKTLKDSFKGKDSLVLAVDPDREGEAIGWHVAEKLGVITKGGKIKKGKDLKRIVFTSITKDSVQEAINNPRTLDGDLFNAQQARRVLDRLVGYKLSPLLWKKIRYGLSAGRVQSVAVKLVVEREAEREAFKPDEYWKITACLNQKETEKQPIVKTILKEEREEKKKDCEEDSIEFNLSKIKNKKFELNKKKEVDQILQKIKNKIWKVSEISSKDVSRNPKPPFTTSTFQQTASSWLGFTPKRSMRVAQKLYEKGMISYMRTDSTNLSKSALKSARAYIEKEIGKKYLPQKPKYYKTKAKVAQEAHEAIRPTDFSKTPGKVDLKSDDKKIYKLIWQRALASQMKAAKLESSKVEIEIGDYLFQSTGQRIIFKGYLEIYPEKVSENILPKLKKGEVLYLNVLFGSQHFTQPPARYTEASLIKELESYGIGRPSTYVPIISTIQTRKYVKKDGKYFYPTDTGKIVTKLLKENFADVVDYDFTAKMEKNLDDVANGEKDWVKMMEKFYFPFEKQIKKKEKEIDRETYTVLEEAPAEIKCPDCGGKMNIKLGKYGRFYSCKKWPDCKGILDIEGKTEDDLKKEAKSKQFLKIYKAAPQTDDGRDYLLKRGRYGKFWAHPDYPKVKDAQPLEYTDEVFDQVYGTPPKAEDGTKMILRRGKYGEFWAHPDYPKKKEIKKLDKKRVKAQKKILGLDT
ncbi:type I DNA topoisomerase [Candidatus Dojkabacteria bacterium]|nr:type I DNA topoisomerase [Candidatus Dojkabacteria bacterium]